MFLKFLVDIGVCDRRCKAGDVIPEAEIPAGYVTQILKHKQAVRVSAAATTLPPAEAGDEDADGDDASTTVPTRRASKAGQSKAGGSKRGRAAKPKDAEPPAEAGDGDADGDPEAEASSTAGDGEPNDTGE